MHLKQFLPDGSKNVFRISATQSGFPELLSLVRLKNHFQSPGIYLINDVHALAEERLSELIMAAENTIGKKNIFICLLLEQASGKKKQKVRLTPAATHLIELPELDERFIKREKQYLPALVRYLFHHYTVPEIPILIAEFIKAFAHHPVLMLSEVKKLSVLCQEPYYSQPENLLKTIQQTDDADIWSFLENFGKRNLKATLLDLTKLEFQKKEESEKQINLLKTHFRKILFLKNIIPDEERIKIKANTDSFFRCRNNWQKKGLMDEVRQIIIKNIKPDRQKNLFQQYFKNDYYLAKMLLQQHVASLKEILELLCHISMGSINIRYYNTAPKTHIYSLVYNYCK